MLLDAVLSGIRRLQRRGAYAETNLCGRLAALLCYPLNCAVAEQRPAAKAGICHNSDILLLAERSEAFLQESRVDLNLRCHSTPSILWHPET